MRMNSRQALSCCSVGKELPGFSAGVSHMPKWSRTLLPVVISTCTSVFVCSSVHTPGIPSPARCCLGTGRNALCAEAAWALQSSGSWWRMPGPCSPSSSCRLGRAAVPAQGCPHVPGLPIVPCLQHPGEVFQWKLGDVYGTCLGHAQDLPSAAFSRDSPTCLMPPSLHKAGLRGCSRISLPPFSSSCPLCYAQCCGLRKTRDKNCGDRGKTSALK